MTVWSCVAIYDGVVDNTQVFQYESDARAWFRDKVDYNGGKEACEPGDYSDEGCSWHFFNSLGGGDCEFVVHKVAVQTHG